MARARIVIDLPNFLKFRLVEILSLINAKTVGFEVVERLAVFKEDNRLVRKQRRKINEMLSRFGYEPVIVSRGEVDVAVILKVLEKREGRDKIFLCTGDHEILSVVAEAIRNPKKLTVISAKQHISKQTIRLLRAKGIKVVTIEPQLENIDVFLAKLFNAPLPKIQAMKCTQVSPQDLEKAQRLMNMLQGKKVTLRQIKALMKRNKLKKPGTLFLKLLTERRFRVHLERDRKLSLSRLS